MDKPRNFNNITAILFIFIHCIVFPISSYADQDTDLEIRLSTSRVADLETTPIDFGSILINGDPGQVVMDANGIVNFSGGVIQVLGFPEVGTLTLDAENTIATITLEPKVDLGGGVVFEPISSQSTVNLFGVAETIKIFGSIDFPANTRSGNYDGILTINITYN